MQKSSLLTAPFRWLKRRPIRRAPRGRYYHPCLEMLEDRLVLSPLGPTQFVVTNTLDSGTGSLRQAILDANAHANSLNLGGVADQITFAIPGSGVQNIVVATQLPDIDEAVTIDGYTQGGAVRSDGTTPATIEIQLSRIGGPTGIDGLVLTSAGSTIAGLMITNFNSGIRIDGAAATDNVIAGNWIGTADGINAAGNFRGILVVSGAANNTIGGADGADRNVISGNTFRGVQFASAGDANSIVGNFIGTDATGTASLGNGGSGIEIGGTANGFIGSNLISSNGEYGILLSLSSSGDSSSDNNVIQGNFIGTDITGANAIGNVLDGILIQNASGNQIGGITPDARNIISGNVGNGISIFAALGEGVFFGGNDNVIVGNYIGTDATGLNPLGNLGSGILVAGGARNQIGGATEEERNVIAGNRGRASIDIIDGHATANTVQGNFIGTDATGNTVLLGGESTCGVGIENGAHDNLVGGSASGAANIIFSPSSAVDLSGALANTIESNFIGVGADGATPLLGNTGSGILLDSGSSSNIVRSNEIAYGANGLMIADGSGNAIQENLIHDNVVNGIVLNEVDGNQISGNDIHANSVNGIVLFGSTHTFIADNIIHDNAGTGILVDQFAFTFSQAAFGNTFSQNSIYANSLLGIDLGGNGVGTGDGVTANDPGDADTGFNNLQNSPVITDVEHVGDNFVIHAALNSTPNTLFRIEFFANSSVDSTGFGEGEVYLGSADVTTDGAGNAATTLSYFGALPFNNLSVTATNLATGDTSEFGGFGSTGSTADPLVVTTTDDTVADDGLTSLREAILYANAHPGLDTITFAIPGDGVHTINVASALPDLTEAVTIDGWSQPGFTTTPIIEVSGASAGFVDGLRITASNVTIRGLVINQFGGAGIALAGPAAFDNVIQGNYIGTDATGTLALPNQSSGIDIRDGAANNLIGTDGDGTNDASEGNVISGNFGTGIFIDHVGADDNVIAGNIIGLDASGTSAIPNSTWGIGINQGARTIVGGDLESERNIISGNSQGGVFVIGAEAVGTMIQGNYIGTDITGSVGLGNTFSGVISGTATGFTVDGGPATSGSASNTVIRDNVIAANQNFGVWLRGAGATGAVVVGNRIGTSADGTAPLGNRLDGVRLGENTATNQIEGNVISDNLRNGIMADGAATVGNRIQGNAIHGNAALGIDLGNDGVTANDPGDADSGTDGLQNYPTITEVSQVGGDTVINASLNSTPNTTFRIEFFASAVADPSGIGEGQQFLGFVNVTTDAFGNAIAAFTNLGALPFSNLSTTATNVSTGDTSEFGPNLFNPLVVTTTSDAIATDGYVSLREAILYANAHAGADTISFNIPGSGVQTIRPLSALPAITDTVVIDGYTQPGASPNTNSLALGAGALGTNAVLKIEIDGSQSSDLGLLSIGTLFSAGANNSTLRGLAINGSHGDGIDVFASGTVLEGNFIGTDATGTIARPNQGDGVNIEMGAANVRIGGATSAARNLISGNLRQGIETHSSGHTIQGNFIGVNAAGTGDLGNANAGIDINPDAGGGSSGGVITIPQSALIPSSQYYTEQIGIGLGTPLLMTGGGSNANVGSSRNDDGFSGPIDLGFTLHFFGHDYTQFYANNNGNISFSDGISSYTPNGPQGADEPIISPFFADVDTRAPGSGVMYLNTQIPNEVIITWDQVGYFDENEDKLDSFQLVLRGPGYDVPAGEGVIAFYWKTMQWETGDASGGSEGFGGTPAAVGFGDGNSSGNILDGSIANGIAAVVQNHKLWFQSDLQPVAGAAANIHMLGNLIAGNDGYGIRTDGLQNSSIQGNFIGTNLTGTAAIGNGSDGINFSAGGDANSLTIGGPNAADGNLISGNTGDGITFTTATGTGHALTIQNNSIGLQADGVSPLGNTGNGVSDGGNWSGTATMRGNRIAFNTLVGAALGGANIQVTQNAIYANGGLGIDLGDNGITANDTGDGDTGPNGLQNYPIITGVAGTTVTGTLNSTANRSFRIELFTNTTADVGTGPAQGRQFLGILNVTTNAAGNASFTFVASSSLTGLIITATATDLTTNETSEFSAPNDAPVIDINGPANLDTIGFNDDDSQGTLVSDLIARTYYSDLNAADPRGIAITGLGNPSDGVWQYALDGTTWQNMGAVSDPAALLLDGRAGSSTRVRFIPTNGFTGQANFTFRAWDQSDGRANGSIADTTPASSSLINFDDVVLSGVPTTISGERYASLGIHFNTVISSGVVNVGNTLTMNNDDNLLQVYGGPGQYPVSPPNFAAAYLADSSRDVLMTFDRPVTSVSLHHDHYPFDAPNVIRLIGLRATGVANQYVVMAYDQKFDNATEDPGDFLAVSFGGLTFDAVLFEIVDEIEGFDDVTFAFSGPSSFSADTETTRLTVSSAPLNVAPQLFTNGTPYLNPVVQGAANDGTSLNELAERTSYTDPDGPQFGIAITGVSTLPADGVWEYQLNFDSGWLPVGDVSPQSSRLLLNTNSAAAIRFVPSVDFTGQATLSYRLWDGSDGNASGALVTGYSTGGSSAFSSAIEDAPLTVVPSGPFVVDSAADVFDGDFSPGHLSLREAVYLANQVAGPNTISFDSSLTDQTIHLNSELDIHEDMNIVGLGAEHLTIDAESESRIFDIGPASDAGNFHADVSISGITLAHGFAFAGGAIYADSADLVLDDVHLLSNRASIGGAIYLSGGSLSVAGSVFSSNRASNQDGDSTGGAIYSQFGSMHITDSTFDHNQSDEDGGAIFNRGELYVTNSTFSANDADDRGGAIYNRGDLFLVNVTLTGNHAAEGGAIYTATSLDNDGADSRTKLDNTIGAGNYYRNTSDASDLGGAFVDRASSHNLIGDPESAAGLDDGDNGNIVGDGDGGVLDINQILDPVLRDNGGPTQTHALSEHSPAQNAGDDDTAIANGLIYDQRGIGFGRIALGAVDIGAFETGSDNRAPTSLDLSPRSFDENLPPHTLIGCLTSTDPNAGDTAVYDLVPGFGDNALFTISCNKLYFNGTANYEALSQYSILVRVTDSGGLSLECGFTIRVNNVNEAPDSLSLSNDTIEENVPANTVFGLLSSTDPDDFGTTPRQGDGFSDMVGNTRTTGQLPVYSIVQNIGAFTKFEIFHGALRILESPNFEAKSSYQIVIRVTDAGGLSYEQPFTIHIRDINETPLTLSLANADALGHLAVNENVPAGTPLGYLFGADPDAGDTLHFALTPGYGDNGKVAIQGNILTLSVSPDYETQRVYDIQIAVIDRAGLRLVRKFSLDIRDLNEAPTNLSLMGAGDAIGKGASLVLPDTTRPGTVIATLNGQDPDAGDIVQLRLIDSGDGRFTLAGNQLIVAPGAALNQDSFSQFTLTFEGIDRGNLVTVWSIEVVLTHSDVISFESALFDQGLFNNGKPAVRLPVIASNAVGAEPPADTDDAEDAFAAAALDFVFASTADLGSTESIGFENRQVFLGFALGDTRPLFGELPWPSRVLERITPNGNDASWASEGGLGATNQSLAVSLSGVSNLLESGDGVRYFSEALRNHAQAQVDVYVESNPRDSAPPIAGVDSPAPIEESFAWTATLKKALCWIAVPIAAGALVMCGWLALRKKRPEPAHAETRCEVTRPHRSRNICPEVHS